MKAHGRPVFGSVRPRPAGVVRRFRSDRDQAPPQNARSLPEIVAQVENRGRFR